MPPAFTTVLAAHLSKTTGLNVIEATHGGTVRDGTVYLAPGDRHLTVVARQGGEVVTQLDQGPPLNFCRPAGDRLLDSAAPVYGREAVAVILTGMGHDGRDGAKVMAAAGALIMAQDEASSVVWGMPGSVVQAGLAKLVRPVEALAAAVVAISGGRAA